MSGKDEASIEADAIQTWDGAASIYAEHVAMFTANSGQFEIIHDAVSLEITDRVLDVGCGPGVLARKIADVAGDVTGIDFSANMVAAAKQAYPDIRFLRANAEALQFPDHSFDVAVVNYCAHLLARPKEVFGEICRVLEPGGRLIVVHPVQTKHPAWGTFIDAVADVLPRDTAPNGVLLNVERPEEYVTFLTECGFTRVTCDEIYKPVKVKEIETLLLAGWAIAGLSTQPKTIQNRIRTSVRQRAEQFKTFDGGYSFPDVVLSARGIA